MNNIPFSRPEFVLAEKGQAAWYRSYPTLDLLFYLKKINGNISHFEGFYSLPLGGFGLGLGAGISDLVSVFRTDIDG